MLEVRDLFLKNKMIWSRLDVKSSRLIICPLKKDIATKSIFGIGWQL